MRIKLAALAVGCMFCTMVPATSQTYQKPFDFSDANPMAVLAGAEHVVPLVRREREIDIDWDGSNFTTVSDLRVSVVVLDDGVGTDLSERRAVYLALWNVVHEYGIAWALVPIAALFDFNGAERLEAGIYQVKGTILDYESIERNSCGFVNAAFTIDARQLSVDVRQAKGMGFGERMRVTTEPSVSLEKLGCAD